MKRGRERDRARHLFRAAAREREKHSSSPAIRRLVRGAGRGPRAKRKTARAKKRHCGPLRLIAVLSRRAAGGVVQAPFPCWRTCEIRLPPRAPVSCAFQNSFWSNIPLPPHQRPVSSYVFAGFVVVNPTPPAFGEPHLPSFWLYLTISALYSSRF